MKIVFFGSSNFAVPALESLLKINAEISCVVTQPDRRKGRHLRLGATDIKTIASRHGLRVFQPENINSSSSFEFLKSFAADLFIIVAYGQLLSPDILNLPSIMPINIHASLLPKYRGAAPVNWAMINGEDKTGVTIMRVTSKMDSGEIIAQHKVKIEADEEAGDLELRLSFLGADLLLKVISLIDKGGYQLIPQDDKKATFAPKLKKSIGLIDWSNTAFEISNLVRGTLPWPGAFTHYQGKLIKIHKVGSLGEMEEGEPGEVLSLIKDGIIVATGKGSVIIKELQVEGKRRVRAAEFVAGHKISPKDKFS